MPGALQKHVRPMPRAQHVHVGVQLVGPGQRTRARHRDRVAPARPTLGRDEVVIAAALVQVGRFGQAQRRALEDDAPLADQPALGG